MFPAFSPNVNYGNFFRIVDIFSSSKLNTDKSKGLEIQNAEVQSANVGVNETILRICKIVELGES